MIFASHSDEFLFELCNSAIWMDEGRIRMQGGLREVLTAYKGRDPLESLPQDVLDRIGQTAALSGNGGEPT